MAAPHNGKVINRRGSYQQAPAPSPKKAEGKRGIPPLTPYGENGRVKKQDGGSFGTLQDRAGAHAPNVSGASPSKSSSRPCTLSGANLTLNDSVSGRNTPGSIFAAQSEARSHFDPTPSSSASSAASSSAKCKYDTECRRFKRFSIPQMESKRKQTESKTESKLTSLPSYIVSFLYLPSPQPFRFPRVGLFTQFSSMIALW